MDDLKKVIEISIALGKLKTIGELYGMYMIEDASGLYKESDIQKRVYKCLQEQLPVWREKYGFTGETELAEVLKIL